MIRRISEEEKPTVQKPDIRLVEAAINGDVEGFTELCRRHYPAMVAIAHSVLGDRHLAEDAAQQAFAKAAVKLPQLKRKSQFAGWLAAICRNAARDIARSREKPASDVDLSTVAANSNNDGMANVVREALGRLSAPAREVIFLRFYDGLSYEQISAVLGISQQAINGRLRRAKKKMAEHLRHRGFAEVRL
ncbi:MAG: sigma-70 family RNA polymerase sigma factor [Phycisphaerales bacterium]|nr:MAG: sigma-70 family RNA polymerase sigma factor [Phycisphaerales bacterium]